MVNRGIDRNFGGKPRIGVFHSMSATTALAADNPGKGFAGSRPVRSAGLCTERGPVRRRDPLGKAGRRRTGPPNPVRFARRTGEQRPWFTRLRPVAPGACPNSSPRRRSGGVTTGQGFELRCPPEYESQICEWALAYFADPAPADFACPVKVIGADPAVRSPFGPSPDLGTLTGLDYDFVPGAGHFLQLEKPTECTELMVAFLEQLGLA